MAVVKLCVTGHRNYLNKGIIKVWLELSRWSFSPGEGDSPQNFWLGMQLGSPNPGLISDQSMSFLATVFRPGLLKFIPILRPGF